VDRRSPDTGNNLSGCDNNANDWQEASASSWFAATSLHDKDAIKSNMIEATSIIVADTDQNDSAGITYAGHGTWVPVEDDDEM
jgi:hypothetical protein